MTSQIDLTITQGQDGDGVRYPVTDATDHPVDVTGWTVVGQVRTHRDSATVIHAWETGDGHTTTGPEGVTLTWTAEQTSQWCGDSYVYGVEITNPAAETFRLVEGRITIDREVVR